MKKSQLRKIIKEEISKVLSEDTNHINQSKLINIELLLKLFAGIDGFDDEDNEEILKALNYPSDYSNEYKAKMIIDYLGDHYSIEGSPEEFKEELLNVIK